MQILKCWPIGVAAVVCFLSVSIYAADTDAQMKARAALREKMQELEQAGQTPAAPAEAVPQTPAAQPAVVKPPVEHPVPPAPKPKRHRRTVEAPSTRPTPPAQEESPAFQPAPPPAQPVPAPAPSVERAARPHPSMQPRADSAEIAKAREAVREKMNELEAEQKAEAAANPAPATPARAPSTAENAQPAPRHKRTKVAKVRPAPQLAPPETAPAPLAPPEPPVPPRAETAAAQPRPNHPKKHKAKVAAAPPAVAQSPAASGNGPFHFRPLQGPPSPLSAQQEQQLAELLRRYDADQITPAQYHHERAKILGEH